MIYIHLKRGLSCHIGTKTHSSAATKISLAPGEDKECPVLHEKKCTEAAVEIDFAQGVHGDKEIYSSNL